MTYIDGIVEERRNSSAVAVELCLSCTSPSIWYYEPYCFKGITGCLTSVSLHTVEGRWTIMRRVLKQGCKLAWLLVIKYVLWLLMPWHHASSRTSAVTIIRLPTNPDPGKSAPLHYSYLTWASWHLRSLATWLFVEQLVTNNNKRNTKTLQYRPFVRGIDKSPMDSPHKRPESQPVFFMWWHHPG